MNDQIVQAVSILGIMFGAVILAPVFIFGGINWLEEQRDRRYAEEMVRRKKNPEDFYQGPG